MGEGALKQRLSALLAQARQHLIRNNASAALALLKDVAGLPDCPAEVRLEAAKMLGTAGANAEAALCYLNAGLGFLYDHGDMTRARQAFASAHHLDPHNLDVIFHLGQADVVEGRTQDGLAKFIDVLRKSNLKHTPALFEAGCVYQANGQYDQAILAFKKVLDRDKNHVQAIVHMGQLHQIKGMIPEAIGYYLQAAQTTREAQQLGTTRQIVNMVLAIDGANARARSMLAELDEKADEEEAEPSMLAPAAPLPAAQAVAATPPQDAAPAAVTVPKLRYPSPDDASAVQAALELEQVRQERERSEAELGKLRAEIEAVKRRRDAVAQADAERSAQDKDAHNEIARRTEAAQRELNELLEQAEKARAQSAEAGASASELEQKASRLKAEVAAQEHRLQEARQLAAQMQANFAKAKTAHEAAMLEIAARRQRAAADLEKAQSEVVQATKHKDAERQRADLSVAELEKKADQLRKDIAAAEARCKETEADAAAAQAALASLETRVTQTAAKAETASADLKDIVDQMRSAQAGSAELTARLAELESAIEAAQSKKRILEDSLAKAKPLAASAEKRRAEADDAADEAEKNRAKREAELKAVEAEKRELEDAVAKLKSLGGAAEQRRAQAQAAAEQAEVLRAKREADAEALAARIATLEATLHDGEARAKATAAESASLAELSAKVSAQRNAVLELEATKVETEHSLSQLRTELETTRKALQEARATLDAQAQSRQSDAQLNAEAVWAIVPSEACGESLRTIETLAAEGELPLEVATELAGLIHEGHAPQALHRARQHANLEASPAPYLLVSGDLCRDLGDVAAARQAYKALALAEPRKAQLVQARMGDLFLAFAERSTAAALQRDDAHFAASADPAKALEAYADLVARFPDDPNFREELGALHEQLGHPTAATLAYTQAMVGYLGVDDVARAVELAPKMLAVHAHDGAAYELAARAHERAGRREEALGALDQALRCYHEAKAASEVERVCRQLAEIAQDPVPYRRELAGLLREAGDASGATEQLLEAAEKLISWSRGADAAQLLKEAGAIAGSDEAAAERIALMSSRAADVQRSVDNVARGDLLVSKGQYDRAAEAYRRALDENPHHAGAAYQLACLLLDQFNDYEHAEQLLQNAAELRPEHAATHYRLALVKAARGQVVEAVELLIALARFDEANADFIEQFAERLEKDAESGDVAAKYRLGIGYRELGRVDEALVSLQSIQREHDYVVLCHNAIGLCLRRQGLDTAAAKRFSKAIETPGYPESQYHEAFYNLGELYEAKDTPESLALALSSFEELYASDCTFKDVADRIKSVRARMGAAERPKVKRLPTRGLDRG